jgi:hypothetical protein
MPIGWVDPASNDFHLTPGSRAVDAGSAEFATARDRDGVLRDARPDAGAYELAGGAGAPARRAGPRLRAVRLRPGTICRRARRGCPRSATLRVRVSRPARVRMTVFRLRRDRAPQRVRSLAAPHRRVVARTLRARGLARGRYVVRVAATASGRRSATVARRLRVR